MNRKGSTLTNWVFVILAISLFLVIIQTQIIGEMNRTYNQSFNIGLSEKATENIEALGARASVDKAGLDDAEVSLVSEGLTLANIGSVAKGIFGVIADFASGSFLRTLMVDQLDIPEIVPTVITILIWLSLIFIMVRIFMRGVTP
ncbi:MAG: hypothetical protein PHD33_04515 [Atribacterota bacterium]|nr:hypothetical protein [Atribacterota bacterium]